MGTAGAGAPLTALALHVTAAFGLAWLVVESDVFAWLRAAVARVRPLAALLDCIVCVSVWTSIGLAVAAPWSSIPLVQPSTAADVVVLVGLTVAGALAASRVTGG